MNKKEILLQNPSDTTKAYNFSNISELIKVTNEELEDTLYIAEDNHIPERKNIHRCYWTDFVLKTKKEAKKLVDEKQILISPRYMDSDCFVYNERTNELLPFKKNDYLMYEHGYFTFDGENYLSYDDNGYEIGRFSYTKKNKSHKAI